MHVNGIGILSFSVCEKSDWEAETNIKETIENRQNKHYVSKTRLKVDIIRSLRDIFISDILLAQDSISAGCLILMEG